MPFGFGFIGGGGGGRLDAALVDASYAGGAELNTDDDLPNPAAPPGDLTSPLVLGPGLASPEAADDFD